MLKKKDLRNLGLVMALVIAVGLAGAWWRNQDIARAHDGHVRAAAERYGVDPALIKAVIWRESRFRAEARGAAGEIGLMQIMPAAAREWADSEGIRFFRHEELIDPGKNVMAGTWYLKRALNRYTHADNPIPYALAEFNAGRSNVLRWNQGAASTNSALFIEQISFPGTRSYVKSVMERQREYRDTAGNTAR